MRRKILVMFMIVPSIFFITSCGNMNNSNDHAVELEDLLTSTRLSVASFEGVDLAQTLGPLGMEIGELQGRLSGLSEEEKVELEEKKERFQELNSQISSQSIVVEDQAVIDLLFDKIESAKSASTEEISEDDWEALEYYSVVGHYEEETVNTEAPMEKQQGTISEGYLYHFRIYENDTMRIWDEEQSRFLEIQFPYDWVEKELMIH